MPAPLYMNDERFPRQARIGSGGEIRRLLHTGRRCRVGPIELFVAPSTANRPRMALVVPRYGRSAVDRNRLLRRLREICRRDWLPAALEREPALDVLLRVRQDAYACSFQQLRQLALEVMERACAG